MPRDFNTNTENNDQWFTPRDILFSLGDFDLDPCTLPCGLRPWDTAKKHYHENGLEKPWFGRVWLNPPYGRETFKWLEKLSDHENGGLALIFARTETMGFHKTVWGKANSVFFFKGRLYFHRPDGTRRGNANAPSCLVSYTTKDTIAIENSGLEGKHVIL